MMFYLTGAQSSLKKSNEVTQTDIMKSLGGYISSSPVPNNMINTLFDMVSLKTIKDKSQETICIGLINKLEKTVSDVTLKIITPQEAICNFKIGAVLADKNLCVESIENRYSQPLSVDFFDATFFKASVDVKISKPASTGESISFEPFDVIAYVERGGNFNGTWNAINKAFSNSEDYTAKRLTEDTFRIERKDDKLLEKAFKPSYLSTDSCELIFLDDFKNLKDNEVSLIDSLEPGDGIGIWIQRTISNFAEKENEEMIDDYNSKREFEKLEEVELVVNYNIVEQDDNKI